MSWWLKPFRIGSPQNKIDVEVFGKAAYSVFSTQNDVIVSCDDVGDVITTDDRFFESDYINNQKTVFEWYEQEAPKIHRLRRDLTSKLAGWDYPNTLITVLIDHSGSLRGDDQYIAYVLASELDRALLDSGVPFEMLGYTTRSWKGGLSRNLWQKAGCPTPPGRLCDLLHILYRSFDDRTDQNDRFKILLDPRVLKENIDGEAIQWAQERFETSPYSKHLILVISDGAPVDDSTMTENDSNLLEKHMISMIEVYDNADNKVIIGLGIGYEVERYFQHSEHLKTLDEIESKIRVLIDKIDENLVTLNRNQ
jgi:cobaltochelatase CobT subunit